MLTICGLSTTATVMVADLPPPPAALVAAPAALVVAPPAALVAAAPALVALAAPLLLEPHAVSNIEPAETAASNETVARRLFPGTCTVSSLDLTDVGLTDVGLTDTWGGVWGMLR
jgi:hypothetical protein